MPLRRLAGSGIAGGPDTDLVTNVAFKKTVEDRPTGLDEALAASLYPGEGGEPVKRVYRFGMVRWMFWLVAVMGMLFVLFLAAGVTYGGQRGGGGMDPRPRRGA